MGGLEDGFLRAADEHGHRPALEVAGATITFAELRDRAQSWAATLDAASEGEAPALTAVLAHRSATAYTGVLAALLRSHGYVPLNPAFPPHRTQSMLIRSGARSLIVDQASVRLLDTVLPGVPNPLVVFLPDDDNVTELMQAWPEHRFIGREQLRDPAGRDRPTSCPDAVAYLLFTSGSTGQPKGVGVTHANVVPFIRGMAERYGITPDDRFSQTFDLTFDLSVFDLFIAWERGACVCVPSSKALLAPGDFVRRSELTVWFSVPSTGVLMKRLGMLKPERYPTLRWSLFCGEALPAEIAQSWAEAAPYSTVENLYGPTEVTIACTAYRWDPLRSPSECEHDLVPIGWPLPGMRALVVDPELHEVAPGEEGELLMAGPQVTPGYWHDPERTAAAFVVPPGLDQVHYRTGDRVRRPEGTGPLRYLGRLDNQIKVHGHRVELGEVEAVLRRESDVMAVAAVGWPRTSSGAAGIVAFLADREVDVEGLRARVASRLPQYMIPRQFHLLDELPYNANGKVDRRALLQLLEDAG